VTYCRLHQSFGDALHPRQGSKPATVGCLLSLTVARAVEAYKEKKKYLRTKQSVVVFASRCKLVIKWVRENEKLETPWAVKSGSNMRKARPVGVGTKPLAVAELELVK